MLLIDRPEEQIASTEEWLEFLEEMQRLETRCTELEDLNQVRNEIEIANSVLKERGAEPEPELGF